VQNLRKINVEQNTQDKRRRREERRKEKESLPSHCSVVTEKFEESFATLAGIDF